METSELPIIVTSYSGPDLDGVSGSIGYAELLERKHTPATAMVDGKPHLEAQWALDKVGVAMTPFTIQNEQEVVLVDTSDPGDINTSINPQSVIEVIDHRLVHKGEAFSNAILQIEQVGAAATLVAERFKELELEPSQSTAVLLFGGIVSNTLNFKASVTTDRDHAMAEWLKEIGQLDDAFVHEMLEAKSDLSDKNLKDVILSDLHRPMDLNGTKVTIGQLEIIGVRELYTQRYEEITTALNEIKQEMDAELGFLSAIDLEEGKNYFAYTNEREKALLQDVVEAHEEGNYLVREGVILRKEIIPILKSTQQ